MDPTPPHHQQMPRIAKSTRPANHSLIALDFPSLSKSLTLSMRLHDTSIRLVSFRLETSAPVRRACQIYKVGLETSQYQVTFKFPLFIFLFLRYPPFSNNPRAVFVSSKKAKAGLHLKHLTSGNPQKHQQ